MDILHAFSKGIKRTRVDHQSIVDFVHIGKISDIVGKLEGLSGTEEATLIELDLDSNPKDWIKKLLADYPEKVDEEIMRYLLYDFTDKMKTRMREETKYVIGLLFSKRLVLCHSLLGGETITPTWDIIPRMLDSDNVMRYVSFAAGDKVTSVRFWERYSSGSFIDWLGLKRRRGFLFGGPFRIRSEIEGMTIEFQLDDEQVEDLIGRHPEFSDGQISFSDPLHGLNVESIRFQGKQYDRSEDFLQIYQAEKYGVSPYTEKYVYLNQTFSPILYKYFDEEKQVISVSGNEINVQLTKDLPNVDILFVNQYIDIAQAYLRKLVTRFTNNEHMQIYHAGCEFSDSPITLGNIQFRNKLRVDEFTYSLIDFYQNVRLNDREFDLIIRYLILLRLSQSNVDLPITHFLAKFAQGVLNAVTIQSSRWTQVEDSLVEYKSSDYLSGGNDVVIKKLADDLKTKLSASNVKLYVFGVEDDGKLDFVSSSKVSSDRLGKICSGVQNELKDKGFPSLEVYPCQIPAADGLIVLIAFSRF